MKITFAEHAGCFAFDLVAETMADAALLTRFGMNRTNEVRSADAFANENGSFHGCLIVAKHKKAANAIPRRK
jgi:hypothetical protein